MKKLFQVLFVSVIGLLALSSLQLKADLNDDLFAAVKKGNIQAQAIESLIEKGADVNAKTVDGKTPLHKAALNNSIETAQLLIEKGADVNAKDKWGRKTPLQAAASNNSIETAQLLIEKGADVNAEDNDGETPLHAAAVNNSIETAQLLIEKGADVNAKNVDGKTPLHKAALWHDLPEIAQLLIEKGADVNAKDKWDETPLHLAAQMGHENMTISFIKNRADIFAKDIGGRTPDQVTEDAEVIRIIQATREGRPLEEPQRQLKNLQQQVRKLQQQVEKLFLENQALRERAIRGGRRMLRRLPK